MTEGTSNTAKRIFLLDGHSLSYRAFFALPTTLATSTGQITNAVYGFTSMLIKLLAEEQPDLIAVAFDIGAPTVRLEKYAEYKAGRPEAPDEFRQQLGLIVEVLETLRIPVIGVEGHEADDAIATLALRAAARGIEAVIVTADRDFFQVVRPGVRVMFNVKGISEIKLYDEAAVEERFGLPPEKYLDYIALKGDPSDNIPGVPGVGEKTASKLVQDFGSIEALLERADELKGRLKDAIEMAGEQLALNKDLAHLHTDLDLEIEPEDCVMGEWDAGAVRRLFTSLEFRTLLERLEDLARGEKPAGATAELDLREATIEQVAELLASEAPKAVGFDLEGRRIRGVAVSVGDGQAAYARLEDLAELADAIADPSAPKWAYDAKDLETAVIVEGAETAGIAFDTMLAGLPARPCRGQLPAPFALPAVPGRRCARSGGGGVGGRLFGESWRPAAAEAAAVALLVPAMVERINRAGLARAPRGGGAAALLGARCTCRRAGLRSTSTTSREMAEGVRDRMATLRAEVFRRRRGGVQPELAAAATDDPLREAPAVAGQADAERAAFDGCERAREAPRPAPDRRCAARRGASSTS